MRTAHDEVLDDLAALVAGESDAIARHAEHLASCDECRDKKHEAAGVAKLVTFAGSDYVANPALIDSLLGKLDIAPEAATPAPEAAKPAPEVAKPAPMI